MTTRKKKLHYSFRAD